MSGDWYQWWVTVYVKATAAGEPVAAALLEIQDIVLGDWRATREELDEVADRIIRECRVPKWPGEHSDAIGKELRRLREERRGAGAPAGADRPGDFAPDCPACGGSGLVVVPHPRCIWERRIILHPAYKRVVTVAVLCDLDGCAAGKAAREKERQRTGDKPLRPTLLAFARMHEVNPVGIFRQFERDQAEAARRAGVKGAKEWAELRERIAERVRAAEEGRDAA